MEIGECRSNGITANAYTSLLDMGFPGRGRQDFSTRSTESQAKFSVMNGPGVRPPKKQEKKLKPKTHINTKNKNRIATMTVVENRNHHFSR